MTIANGVKSLKRKLFRGDLEDAWKNYIKLNPSTSDLAGIFFLNKNGQLNQLVWKELKCRDDIRSYDLQNVILHCETSEKIVQEAWKIFSQRNPKPEELEFLSRFLDESHPISMEIQEKFGTNSGHLLRKIKKM